MRLFVQILKDALQERNWVGGFVHLSPHNVDLQLPVLCAMHCHAFQSLTEKSARQPQAAGVGFVYTGTPAAAHALHWDARISRNCSRSLDQTISSRACEQLALGLVVQPNQRAVIYFFIVYTVPLLTHVLCKPTHFFFHSFIATISYSLQTSFSSVMKDWADKYHIWGTPTRSPSRSNSR